MFFRGYFSQGDQRYFIEPLSPTAQDEQEHALFKDEPQEQQTNSDCGMDDVLWAHGFHRNMVPPDSSLVVSLLLFIYYFICNALKYPVMVALRSRLSSCKGLKLYSHC